MYFKVGYPVQIPGVVRSAYELVSNLNVISDSDPFSFIDPKNWCLHIQHRFADMNLRSLCSISMFISFFI